MFINNPSLNFIDSMQLAGRAYTSLSSIFQLRSLGYGGAGGVYSDFVKEGAAAAYQVPVGKTLQILGTRTIITLAAAGAGSALGHATAASGFSNPAAPAGITWYGGVKNLGYLAQTLNAQSLYQHEFLTDFTIAAGKYPVMWLDAGCYHIATLFCLEV